MDMPSQPAAQGAQAQSQSAAAPPPSAPSGTSGQPRRGRGCLRWLLVLVGSLALIVIVAAVAAWFAFDFVDRSITEERLGALSESEALLGLSEAAIEPPDLSQYAYVSSEGLQGPRFESITIGDIVLRESLFDSLLARSEGEGPDDAFDSYRVVSAYATWRNSYVEVQRFVVQRFVFDADASAWQTTTSEVGAPTVVPVRGPNLRLVQDEIVPMLWLYDSALGEHFTDARVSFSDESLSAEGGSFVATLATDAGATCSISFDVEWVEGAGWAFHIASIDDSGAGTVPRDGQASGEAVVPTPLDAASPDEPAQLLSCHEGNLVRLEGTLRLSGDLFVLDVPLTQVDIAGRTYQVRGFVINAPSRTLSELIGTELTVTGYISVANAVSDMPLSLMLSS